MRARCGYLSDFLTHVPTRRIEQWRTGGIDAFGEDDCGGLFSVCQNL